MTPFHPPAATTIEPARSTESMIDVEQLNFFYGDTQALRDITLRIPANRSDRLHRSLGLREIDAAALHSIA